MSLFGNLTEVPTIGIFTVLRMVDIRRHGDEIFSNKIDNALVRENGHTARNTIVSDTTQRVAVHGPQK